ncbi:hypothetical protein H5410_051612 [Solanum commersonii]|uniref:Uncharacterized protein n=1 Tax=Solanum commersonii TaxID=4109 RepID=A0A9J5WYM8_SOLCO|nr:hypothetical protein H5410_051612 [Solanum commersonii]
MHGAIAALNNNPSSLFTNEQAKKLLTVKYEFPVMEFLTEEDMKKLDDCIKSEARLKVKYEKKEEQGRELEEFLQDIRTR